MFENFKNSKNRICMYSYFLRRSLKNPVILRVKMEMWTIEEKVAEKEKKSEKTMKDSSYFSTTQQS